MHGMKLVMLLCVVGTLVVSGCASLPLHSAVCRNDIGVVKELLGKGADVNQRGPVRPGGMTGMTALGYAASNGNLELIKILLDKGADVDLAFDGHLPPLSEAACYGHASAAKLLIEKGADASLSLGALSYRASTAGLSRGPYEGAIRLIERLTNGLPKPDARQGAPDTPQTAPSPTALPMPKESAVAL